MSSSSTSSMGSVPVFFRGASRTCRLDGKVPGAQYQLLIPSPGIVVVKGPAHDHSHALPALRDRWRRFAGLKDQPPRAQSAVINNPRYWGAASRVETPCTQRLGSAQLRDHEMAWPIAIVHHPVRKVFRFDGAIACITC